MGINKFHKDLTGTDLHIPGVHAMTTHTGTAWRLFYSDGTGALTELALGTTGYYLASTGAASAPTWAAGTITPHAMASISHTAGNWKTFYSDGAASVQELANGTANRVKVCNGAAIAPSWNEVTVKRFFPAEYDANYGDYRVRSQTTGTTYRGSFIVPDEFASLVSLKVVFAPASNFAGVTTTLNSDYGANGESTTIHSETSAPTYSGTAGTWNELDISGVFTALGAGDRCGISIAVGATLSTLNILGFELKYKRTF